MKNQKVRVKAGVLCAVIALLLAIADILLLTVPAFDTALGTNEKAKTIIVLCIGVVAVVLAAFSAVFAVGGAIAAKRSYGASDRDAAFDEENASFLERESHGISASAQKIGGAVAEHPYISAVAALAAIAIPACAVCAITNARAQRRRAKKRERIKDLIKTILD